MAKKKKGKAAKVSLRGVTDPKKGGAKAARIAKAGKVPTRPTGTVKMDKILPRHWPPIRAFRPLHAIGLAASIHEDGLVEPIVVDREGRLLAGAHRLGACWLLAAGEGERVVAVLDAMEQLSRPGAKHPDAKIWSPAMVSVPLGTGKLDPLAIPVRIFPFDSAKQRAQAHKIEVTENEQREQMTRPELEAYMDFLQETGKFTFSKGRPPKGVKSGYQEMAANTGINKQTLRKMLSPRKIGKPTSFSAEEMQKRQLAHDVKKLRETAQRVMARHGEVLNKHQRSALEVLLAEFSRGD